MPRGPKIKPRTNRTGAGTYAYPGDFRHIPYGGGDMETMRVHKIRTGRWPTEWPFNRTSGEIKRPGHSGGFRHTAMDFAFSKKY